MVRFLQPVFQRLRGVIWFRLFLWRRLLHSQLLQPVLKSCKVNDGVYHYSQVLEILSNILVSSVLRR